jgi:hypothetical protein
MWLASHAAQFGLHKYKPGDPYNPERFVDPRATTRRSGAGRLTRSIAAEQRNELCVQLGFLGVVLGSAVLPAESSILPTPQTAPMTAQEKKNLDLVMTWWREVLESAHVELAPKYQAENYISTIPTSAPAVMRSLPLRRVRQ